MKILHYFDQFVRLLYPHICVCCMEQSIPRENLLCIRCLVDVPYTDHFGNEENKVVQHFYGRAPIKHGAGLMYFSKNAKVQNLIHNFKYKGDKNIGTEIGLILGDRILSSPFYKDINLLIPVPMHLSKRKKRGFNQTEVLAEGINRKLEVGYRSDVLVKIFDTNSQTKKTREERQINVYNTIGIRNKKAIKDMHVLLVDDIITTGATAEASVKVLLEGGAKSVSVVVAGVATNDFM